MSEYQLRVSSKGQVTIPSELRKKMNLKEGDSLRARFNNGVVTVDKSSLTIQSVRGMFPTPPHLIGRDMEEIIEEATADHADWLMRQERSAKP